MFAAALALAPWLPAAADTVGPHQDTMGFQGQGVPFLAQSFTPSASGTLTMVKVGSKKTLAGTLKVSVRDADQVTQTPVGSDVATATATSVSGTWQQELHPFPLQSTYDVRGGHTYAIVIQAPQSGFFWYYNSDPTSDPRGQLSVCGSGCTNVANWSTATFAGDLAYQTWMSGGTPTPSPTPSPTPKPNVAPTVQPNSSNVTVKEGTATASMAGTYSDPDGDTVDFTADSGTVARTTGTSNGTWTWTGPAASDESTQTITVSGDDHHGHTVARQFTVTVANVDPTATIASITNTIPIVLATGENVSFTGSFTDPGVMDTHSATWSWDGATTPQQELGQGGSGTSTWMHHFATAGAHTVTFTVRDDDGGQGSATATVKVMTTAEAIDAISKYLSTVQGLNQGQLHSLEAKLDAAKASYGRGDEQACSNQLGAFLNELLAAAKTGKVSASDANNLGLAVTTVKGSLGTYNRFLEWLPLAI